MTLIRWLSLILIFAGCSQTTLDNAAQLAGAHDYAGAIELLTADGFDTTSSEALSLRAKAFFVEERKSEGYADLARIVSLDERGSFHAARVLYDAVEVIAREKYRAREAVELLDSAAMLDPSLIGDVVNLAWRRGLEYLMTSGDAGWLFIACAQRFDPNSLGRLRAHDIILARRYEEMETVARLLPTYAGFGRKYLAIHGRFPTGLEELQAAFPESGLMARDGWEIGFGGREGQLVAEATVSLGNSFGIKRGTTLTGG